MAGIAHLGVGLAGLALGEYGTLILGLLIYILTLAQLRRQKNVLLAHE
jgi:hypothetical protein